MKPCRCSRVGATSRGSFPGKPAFQHEHDVRRSVSPQPMSVILGVSAKQRSPGSLIFGLIRLRSFTFAGIQINTAMQVTDVNGIRRTIIA
jgi:hypothetical protein